MGFNIEKFTDAVILARANAGLTFKQLAALSGVSVSVLWYIEQRRSKTMLVDVVVRLCSVLDLNIKDFIEEVENAENQHREVS